MMIIKLFWYPFWHLVPYTQCIMHVYITLALGHIKNKSVPKEEEKYQNILDVSLIFLCILFFSLLLVVVPNLSSHLVTSFLAVCGKHPTFDPERPADSHWPWLAAIYRRSTNGAEIKVTKADSQAGSLKRDGGAGTGNYNQASDWQMVCSGALVNQRSVVAAAHCVTELGKVFPLDAAEIKVVVGKHFRDDHRESKGLQHLRVSSWRYCFLMTLNFSNQIYTVGPSLSPLGGLYCCS